MNKPKPYLSKNNFPIDLVYLWVDGFDPKWRAKKNSELTKAGKLAIESTGHFRFDDNDELLFSLRSAEKFAPWLNHIFIVTDKQTPKWLNLRNPKISVVDHSKIMPAAALPTFSSTIIEFFLQNIPNLSQHFIFANDDMLFTAMTNPDYFFTKTGKPIIRANDKKHPQETGSMTIHDENILNSIKMAKNLFGEFNYKWLMSHNIDPYVKSDMIETVKIPQIAKKLKTMLPNHFRDRSNLHRVLFYYFGIAKRGYKIVGRTLWTRLRQALTFHFRDQPVYTENARKWHSRHLLFPKLMCIEDPTDAEIRKSNRLFLQNMFPKKSRFEK